MLIGHTDCRKNRKANNSKSDFIQNNCVMELLVVFLMLLYCTCFPDSIQHCSEKREHDNPVWGYSFVALPSTEENEIGSHEKLQRMVITRNAIITLLIPPIRIVQQRVIRISLGFQVRKNSLQPRSVLSKIENDRT